MKKIFLMAMLSLLLLGVMGAEQITKVAVLDYSRILLAFYADSGEVRRIEAMKADFANEVRRLQAEILNLEEQKLEADSAGESSQVLQLENLIEAQRNHLQEYIRVKGNRIREAEAQMGSSESLAREILNEIQYVAESNGYSLVLNKADPDLLWWNYEVDITDKVLERLMD